MSRQYLTLTAWQRRMLLRQMQQTRDARVYRRTLAILEIAQGKPIADVARALGVSRRTAYYWAGEYARQHNAADLLPAGRPGRPTLWTEEARALILKLLSISPTERGYFAVNWTVSLLKEELWHATGDPYSDDTIRRELRRLGYVWKRPRYVLEPDPEREKKRRIRRQIRDLPPRSVLLAEDDTDLLLFPPLRSGWSLRGQPAKVWLSGRNARRVIFGAMNLSTGRRLFLLRHKQRASDFQEFLRMIHHHYWGWHVALLLDEDRSHTAQGSLALIHQFNIECLWLPNRSPHLNPVERLWGEGKDVISANKQYASIEAQVDRFLEHLYDLSNSVALETGGVYSRNFWLRNAMCNYFCGPA